MSKEMINSKTTTKPPVDLLAIISMCFVIAGAIYMISESTSSSASTVAYIADVIALVVLLFAVGALVKIKSFAWSIFWLVFKWTLLVYCIISAFLLFIFTFNHMPESRLLPILFSLILFAVDVPLNISFTVAYSQTKQAATNSSVSNIAS
jgi:uncharacterized membrane protein